MAWRSRAHAPAPGEFQTANSKMDANGPIAPQISALRRAFPAKRPQDANTISRPTGHPLFPRRNLLGCHDILNAKEGIGRPHTRFGSSPLSNGV
jgi:hypothetical protein